MFKKKNIVLALGALATCFSIQTASANVLTTTKTVIGETDFLNPKLQLSSAQTTDIFVAYTVDGGSQFTFLSSDGLFSSTPIVFKSLSKYSGELELFNLPASGIPMGQYQLHAVTVKPGGDVFHVGDWIGGFSALNSINFSIGFNKQQINDLDDDGYRDDDFNKDGFPNYDSDRDGYNDDDLDRNGISDDKLENLNYIGVGIKPTLIAEQDMQNNQSVSNQSVSNQSVSNQSVSNQYDGMLSEIN